MPKKAHKNNSEVALTYEEKFDAFIYKSVIPMCFWGLFQYVFLKEETIGGDYRYSVYIIGIPYIIGLVSLTLFRKNILFLEIDTKPNFLLKLKSIGSNLMQVLVISYLCFCTIPHVIWNSYNKHVDYSHQPESITCRIKQFQTTSDRDKIYFSYRGELESVNVSYKSIQKYVNEPPKDYRITLHAREGIWGHYIIDSWKINKLTD